MEAMFFFFFLFCTCKKTVPLNLDWEYDTIKSLSNRINETKQYKLGKSQRGSPGLLHKCGKSNFSKIRSSRPAELVKMNIVNSIFCICLIQKQ